MEKNVVTCPNCAGTLPLSAWTPGRQMRCPRCTTVFRLGTTAGAATPVTATTTTAPEPATPIPTPQPQKNPAMLLAAVLGGLVVFVGGTVGLTFLVAYSEKKPDPGPVAVTPNPTPTPTPNPNPGPTGPVTPNPSPPVVPERRLPAELQEKVDAAIAKGLAFVRTQHPSGGSSFLLGLTLLECGVPRDDPAILKIAKDVRAYAKPGQAVRTYETTLCLLFLDRLGDPADRLILQTLGLRLLAGQLSGGGWTYGLPGLSNESEQTLFAALQQARPEKAGELYLRDRAGLYLDVSGRSIKEDSLEAVSLKDIEVGHNKLLGVQESLKKFPELQNVPSLRVGDEAPKPGGKGVRPRQFASGEGDNSNTQFAAIGLWVASRHGVPCERALALLAARFRTSQSANGGWGYHVGSHETQTMTCAGLLALAIGHGVRVEDAGERREDGQIVKGMKALANHLKDNGNARNLYFMWSLERVGVLFGVDQIGTTDWYEWGSRKLVASQGTKGSWAQGVYPGSTPLHDTCFALLFLKRGNLVSDLSNKLDRVLDIKSLRRQD